MKKILSIILALFLPALVYGAISNSPIFGDGNINTLDQFTSTTTPYSSVTQRIFGKPLKLTGLNPNECLKTSAEGFATTTGAPCGSGGGAGSGTISTSTPVGAGAINLLTYWTGLSTIGATSSPTVGYITGTSTTATSSLQNLSIPQELKQGEVILVRYDGVQRSFPATSTTEQARGVALVNAFAAVNQASTTAYATSTIMIGPGIFNVGNNALDMPKYLSVIGSGKFTTKILSAYPLSLGTTFGANSYTSVQNLWIKGDSCWGYGNSSRAMTKAYIYNIFCEGATDGIYFNTTQNVDFIADAFDATNGWDVVSISANSGIVVDGTFRNSKILSIGPATSGQLRGIAMAAASSTLRIFSTEITANDNGDLIASEIAPIKVISGTVKLYSGYATSTQTAGNEGTVYDLDNAFDSANAHIQVAPDFIYNKAREHNTIEYLYAPRGGFNSVDITDTLKLGEVSVTIADGTSYIYRATTTSSINRGNALFNAILFAASSSPALSSTTVTIGPGSYNIGGRKLPNFPNNFRIEGQGRGITTIISTIDNSANVFNVNLNAYIGGMTIFLPRHDVNNNIFGPQLSLVGTSTITVFDVETFADSDTFFWGSVASNGTTINVYNSKLNCGYDCWASNNNSSVKGIANFYNTQFFAGDPYWAGVTGGSRGINGGGGFWDINVFNSQFKIGTGTLNMSTALYTNGASTTINCYNSSIETNALVGKNMQNDYGVINNFGCTYDRSKTQGYIDNKEGNYSRIYASEGQTLGPVTGLAVADFGGGSSYTAGQVLIYAAYAATKIGTTTAYSSASTSVAYAIGTTGDAPIFNWNDPIGATAGTLICRSINGGAYNFYRNLSTAESVNPDDGTTGWVSGTCPNSPIARLDYSFLNSIFAGIRWGLDTNNQIRVASSTGTSTFSGGLQTNTLNITSTSATSTFANGITLTTGCFSVNGTCIASGSGSGTVNSGIYGTLAWYAANGTAVSATSTRITVDSVNATGTVASILPYASSTYATIGTASTTNLTVRSLTGPLQAINGVVSASSTLAAIFGGTGWSTINANTILLGNGADRVATTAAGTNGQVLALVNGVPTWQATTTLANITGTLPIASGGTNNTSISSRNLLWFDGTSITATSSILTVGSIISTTTATSTFNGSIAVTEAATSSFQQGINILSGCFALNNVCIGASGSVTGGTAGMLTSWTNSTTLTATGTPTAAAYTATSTTATSTFAGALTLGGATSAAQLDISSLTGVMPFRASNVNGNIELESNGNFGVGTTSAYSKLSVAGQVVAQNYIATSTTATSTFAGDITQGSGVDVFTVGYNGNVGIGNVTSPSVKLVASSTGTQIRVQYDASNYSNITVLSNGTTRYTPSADSVSAYTFASTGFANILDLDSTNLRVGVAGSTTPWAKLSIQSNDTTSMLFGVATTSGKTLNLIDPKGHQYLGGDPVTVTNCGSSPFVYPGSNNNAGRIRTGNTALLATCDINFADGGWTTYSSWPVCSVFFEGGSTATGNASSTATTTKIIATGGSTWQSINMGYTCTGFAI